MLIQILFYGACRLLQHSHCWLSHFAIKVETKKKIVTIINRQRKEMVLKYQMRRMYTCTKHKRSHSQSNNIALTPVRKKCRFNAVAYEKKNCMKTKYHSTIRTNIRQTIMCNNSALAQRAPCTFFSVILFDFRLCAKKKHWGKNENWTKDCKRIKNKNVTAARNVKRF